MGSNLSKIADQSNLEQFWSTHIQQRQLLRLSKSAYCKQNNLVYHQFLYWEQKILESAGGAQLIPVEIDHHLVNSTVSSDDTPPKPNNIQHLLCALNLKNGHVLQIFDVAALNVLTAILR